MCYSYQQMTGDEVDECLRDPTFCIACRCNRDIPVDKDHICAECAEAMDEPVETNINFYRSY